MAENQRLLTETGLDHLQDFLNTDGFLEDYMSSSPQYGLQQTDFCWLNNFRVDNDKLSKMVSSSGSDVECAILLYEALPDLNGLFASHAPFWTHLSHFELLNYMRKRWSRIEQDDKGIPKSIDDTRDYISRYWFYHSPMTTWLSSLWWSVYMTVDNDLDDPYELTRVLFHQEDLRTRTLGTYLIFRHEPARIAILEFIRNNKEGIFSSEFQGKVRYMMKLLNLLGGSKQLAYMDKDYFVNYLENKKEDIVTHYKD